MMHVIMTEEIIKTGIDQIVKIGEFNLVDKEEVDKGMNRIIVMIIGKDILGGMSEHTKILKDRTIERNIEQIIGMKTITERGRSRSRERSF